MLLFSPYIKKNPSGANPKIIKASIQFTYLCTLLYVLKKKGSSIGLIFLIKALCFAQGVYPAWANWTSNYSSLNLANVLMT
jgi:hypothetical protein